MFTKMLNPVAQKLRKQGITMVIYLDDILIIAQTEFEYVEKTLIQKM